MMTSVTIKLVIFQPFYIPQHYFHDVTFGTITVVVLPPAFGSEKDDNILEWISVTSSVRCTARLYGMPLSCIGADDLATVAARWRPLS
ncbi:hypothetical protein L9F63_009393, partial [Diploptera punctata]